MKQKEIENQFWNLAVEMKADSKDVTTVKFVDTPFFQLSFFYKESLITMISGCQKISIILLDDAFNFYDRWILTEADSKRLPEILTAIRDFCLNDNYSPRQAGFSYETGPSYTDLFKAYKASHFENIRRNFPNRYAEYFRALWSRIIRPDRIPEMEKLLEKFVKIPADVLDNEEKKKIVRQIELWRKKR
jgi:hypothetical protein